MHLTVPTMLTLLRIALVPVLIDFGAAREKASQVGKVMSTMRVVKDGYSPQEFYIAGSMQSNSRDLYALGARPNLCGTGLCVHFDQRNYDSDRINRQYPVY